ncbi:MAG: hypothetical protein E7423_04035 [Ruminococcaceae bacterium]|nr:hypothetical protein [Oscillospiraceae bacterium]
MQRIELEGKKYWRSDEKGKWADERNFVVDSDLQKKLNAAYELSLNPEKMDVLRLKSIADGFRKNGSNVLAVQYYQLAMKKATLFQRSFLLPCLAACYRAQGRPQDVIDLTVVSKQKYGEKVLSSALITVCGAAYCDLKDYDRAEKCCDRAYAMKGGTASEELKAVYARIRKETK